MGYRFDTLEFTQPAVVRAVGFDPFFGFFRFPVLTNQVLESYSVNKPGWNGGIGLSFGGYRRAKFYAEARYHRMYLGGDRHTGPFAAGSALSMDAAVKPLAAGAVKEVRLDTTHKVISFGLEANGSPGRAIEAFRRALADPAANMKMLRVVREGKLLEAQ